MEALQASALPLGHAAGLGSKLPLRDRISCSMGKGLLVLSNGHGEDLIALRLIDALHRRCPSLEIAVLPLVGEGSAFAAAEQAGALRRIGPRRHLPSGEALFAPTERDEHHLTCVDCGTSVVLQHCPMHHAHLDSHQAAGFQLLFHTLEFFGLCGACQRRQAS